MNTTLDYIGSAVVAGMVVLIVLTLNSNIVSSSFQRNLDMVSQEAAVNLTTIVETDLKRLGYFVTESPLVAAEKFSIKFWGDVDDDGTPDLVSYAVGDSTRLLQTKNPADRPLFRRVNAGDSLNVASGLVRFAFSYLDSTGSVIPYDSLRAAAPRGRVRLFVMDLRIEPTEPVDSTFIPVEIKRTISPKNARGW